MNPLSTQPILNRPTMAGTLFSVVLLAACSAPPPTTAEIEEQMVLEWKSAHREIDSPKVTVTNLKCVQDGKKFICRFTAEVTGRTQAINLPGTLSIPAKDYRHKSDNVERRFMRGNNGLYQVMI